MELKFLIPSSCPDGSHDVDMVEYAKQFTDPSTFVLPQYSHDDICQLEEQTKQQHECQLWSILRKGRVSASIAHEVITRTQSLQSGRSTDCSSLVSLIVSGRSINPNLSALKYGRENESRAAEKYQCLQRIQHANLQVVNSGLFIHEVNSFMCASPDRLVRCDCCGDGLLEVKCPISIAGEDARVAALPFLEDRDGIRSLKTNHKYHTQVQMQMAVSKRLWCDFFVYSEGGHHMERIQFNSSFWHVAEARISDCFYTYVVPSIVACS